MKVKKKKKGLPENDCVVSKWFCVVKLMFPNGLSYIDVDGMLNSSNAFVAGAEADAVDAAVAAATAAAADDDNDDADAGGCIGSFKFVFDERDK